MGTLWDIHPDGRRFLMMKPSPEIEAETAEKSVVDRSAAEAPRQINIVLNWFEELKERVPT